MISVNLQPYLLRTSALISLKCETFVNLNLRPNLLHNCSVKELQPNSTTYPFVSFALHHLRHLQRSGFKRQADLKDLHSNKQSTESNLNRERDENGKFAGRRMAILFEIFISRRRLIPGAGFFAVGGGAEMHCREIGDARKFYWPRMSVTSVLYFLYTPA